MEFSAWKLQELSVRMNQVANDLTQKSSESAQPAVRIMFVDDEPNILDLLSLQFSDLGCETLSVNNPSAALYQYKQFKPHAVILDYNMPYLKGLSVLEQLKQFDPQCRAFLVTAYSDREILSRATRLGVCGCFSKPINFRALTEAVMASHKR
jgi:CheY-like chemotaxis protein